jgi:hypothetical protein
MAMPIVEAPRPVTGGVDTYLDAQVAAVVDVTGGVLAVESFPTVRREWPSRLDVHYDRPGHCRWGDRTLGRTSQGRRRKAQP